MLQKIIACLGGGGEPVFGAAGARTRARLATALREADPDVILVAPCGYTVEQSHGGSLLPCVRGLLRSPTAAMLRCEAARDGFVWLD